MLKTTRSNDLFLTYTDENLIFDYEKNLIELYQPFISTSAVALYLSLNKYNYVSTPIPYHKIMATMSCPLQDLPEAFSRLEAANLLTTYKGMLDGYQIFVYQLNSPLTVYEFLKDPLLTRVLTSYIGEEAVAEIMLKDEKRTQGLEKIHDLQNVSHLLKDVYRESLISHESVKPAIEKETAPEKFSETKFTFDTFLIMLPPSIRAEFDFTLNIKNLLLKLSQLYDLNSEEMAIIFNMSLQKGKGTISEDLIRKEAYEYMMKTLRIENAKDQIEMIPQPEQLEVATTITNPTIKQALSQMKKLSTFDYVKMITNSLTPQDYKNVERLIIDYHLAEEVVNVLINYVYHDKKTLSLPLMEAIAQNWHKRNITTAEEAYLALKENTKKSKARATKTTEQRYAKRTEKISNFDDQKVELTDEEIKKLLEGLE